MKKFLIISIFGFLTLNSFSQETVFQKELSNKTSGVDSLNYILNYLENLGSNYDYSAVLSDLEHIEYSVLAWGIDSLNANLYEKKGVVYRSIGELDLAEQSLLKARALYEKMNDDKKLCHLIFILSKIPLAKSDFKTSIDLCNQAYEMAIKNDDKEEIAKILNQTGINYDYQGEFDKAIDYYKKALDIYLEIGNKLGMANTYNNLGVMYDLKGELDEALSFYQKSLKLEEELGNVTGVAGSKINVGLIHQMKNDFLKAEKEFLEALDLYESKSDFFGITISYMNLAELYRATGRMRDAVKFIDLSIDLSNRLEDAIKLKECLELKVKILKSASNYKDALAIQEDLMELTDSIESNKYSSKIAEYETQLEDVLGANESLEQINNQLIDDLVESEKINQKILISAIIAVIILFLGIVYLKLKSKD